MAQSRSDLATLAAVSKLLGAVLIVAALSFARDVILPLALGLMLSFLLSPLVNRLQRMRVPNVLAVVVTALLAFVLLAGMFTLLGREISGLLTDLPNYKHELITKTKGLAGMTGEMGGSLDDLADEVSEAIEQSGDEQSGEENKDEDSVELRRPSLTDETASPANPSVLQRWSERMFPDPLRQSPIVNDGTSPKTPLYIKSVEESLPLASWATTAGSVLGPLATAGLVSVFALFILIHREDLRDRMIAVISHGDYVTTTEALNEAAERISRYLVAQTIINAGYGILLAVGLLIIGATMTESGVFPNAILWGVLTTCLRFIPFLGPTAAAIFPSAIAFAMFPGYTVFITVVLFITVMELTCNNIFEPWLYGSSTGISAVAVIIAAVFWAWLWGPIGLLLSTPLTVCLVVLGRYVPRFKMFADLLSEEIHIRPSLRFYQRLLAGDERRAHDLLADYVTTHGFDQTCDDVLVPVLKRIRSDHEAEYLSITDENRLIEVTGTQAAKLDAIVETLSEETSSEDMSSDETPSQASEPVPLPLVIGCASHHFSEAVLLNLIRLGSRPSFRIETIDEDVIPSEAGRRIVEQNPVAVVITVLPRGGFAQARYLCRSIRRAGYEGVVIVACMGRFKRYDRLFVKFRKAGATGMTTSYSRTRLRLQSVAERNTPPPRRASVLVTT